MNLSLLTFSMMRDRIHFRMDADQLCRIAQDAGIDSLDLMEYEVKLYGQKKLQAALAKYGMTCGCIVATLPFFAEVETYPQKLEQALNCAEALGAGILMVVPGGNDRRTCTLLTKDEQLRRAVELYTIAVCHAAKRNIQVGFENTPQNYKHLCTPEECRYVLDQVKELGFIFDTGNFRVADPDGDELAAYELLRDRIIRVHLKDVAKGPFRSGEECVDGQSIRCVVTGAGIIPMETLVRRLETDGYQGVCSVEYAALPGVFGEDHTKYLRFYVSQIRAYAQGTAQLPPYVSFPGLDKPVPRIFFGTAIKPMLEGKNANALLDAVYASGINVFDCERGYGKAEKSLGQWIRDRNIRDRVILLTKCGNVDLRGQVKVDRKVINSELEKSLKLWAPIILISTCCTVTIRRPLFPKSSTP